MIRSLFAIIVAVIIGLTTAKFVEGAGLAMVGGGAGDGAQGPSAGGAHFAALLAGWGLGAFAASLCALLIAGRWAPLGALAAGTMFLAALIAQLEAGLGGAAWLAAAPATALGGFAAIRLTGASAVHPANRKQTDIFDD